MSDRRKEIISALEPLILSEIGVRSAKYVGFAIALIGLVISIFFENTDAFSRSGSLIVVYALILTLFDYSSSIDSSFKETRDVLGEEYKEQEKLRIEELIKKKLHEHGVEKDSKEVSFLAAQRAEIYWEMFPLRFGACLKMKAAKTEIGLAVMGTLIWGFGNIIT